MQNRKPPTAVDEHTSLCVLVTQSPAKNKNDETLVKFENFRLDLHDGRADRHDILFPKPDYAGFRPVVHRKQLFHSV